MEHNVMTNLPQVSVRRTRGWLALTSRLLVLACLVMLALVVQGRPAAEAGDDYWRVTWSQDPAFGAVAGKPLLIRVSVQNMSGSNITADVTFEVYDVNALEGGYVYGGCTVSLFPPKVTCDNMTFEPEDTFEFYFILDVPPNFVGGAAEARDIGALFFLREGDTLDSDHAVMVSTSADLSITKLGDPQAWAGEDFEYTLVVDNFGPSRARNVVIEDDILSSEDFTVVTPLPLGCEVLGSGNDQKVICDLGNMDPGDRQEKKITVQSNETAVVNNSALVSSHVTAGDPSSDILDPDPVSFNNRATAFTAVTDVADLHITKTTALASVTAGQTIAYTVIVTNTGPSTAENVVVYDYLPPYIRDNVQISATQGECTPGTPPTSPAICNLGTLLSGQSVDVNVIFELDPSYPIDPALGAVIQNEVSVRSDTFDPDNSDNRDSVETPVEAHASLSFNPPPTVVPAIPIAGDEFHIDFTASNNGPSTAQDAILEVHFSGAIQNYIEILNVSAGSSPFSKCTTGIGDNSVRCQLGDMKPSVPITGTLNLRLKDDTPGGNYPNAVNITLETPTPGSLISFLLDLFVDEEADLVISKVDTGSPATAGQTTRYTFVVVNLGPSAAEDVVVNDTLPSTLFTYLDGTDDCSGGAGSFTCSLGTIAKGGKSQFIVTVGIDPSVAPDDYTDTATVTSDTEDPNEDNNTDTQVTRVQDVADLWVRKFGRPDQIVVAGELMTYTIMVDNLGPSDARNVVVTDTLDPDLTFVSSTPAPVDPNPPADPLTGEKDYVYNLGTIADEGRAEIQIVVQANRNIGPPFDPITNRVEARSTAEDPNLRNNVTERVTRVTAHSDLQVTKTALGQNVQDSVTAPAPLQEQADKVTAGTFITYTINVTNTGPSDATNVFVQDRVPREIEPQGATITRGDGLTGSCVLGGLVDGNVQCNIDTLGVTPAITSRATVVITGFVASATPEGFLLNNNVTVGSDNYDPDNSNSIFHNQTQVNARADLVITKTDDPDPVIAGELPKSMGGVTDGKLLKYTITVTNTGPSDALNVVVSDTLPINGSGNPQVVFINSTLKSFGADLCSADPIHPERVRCKLGDMVVGEVVSFDILVFVKPDIVPAGSPSITIINTADVLSDTHDPVTNNNRATQTTTVQAKADLFIQKTDNPDPVVAGKQLAYTISFGNKGPSTARRVTITDVLPIKFEAVDVDGNPANGVNPCVPIDPDEEVICSVTGAFPAPQTVTLESLKVRGKVQYQRGAPGVEYDLDPGEGYSFGIVVKVESAYVLDKGVADSEEPLTNPDNPARNTAYIASQTTSGVGGFYPDINPADNQDTALTAVIAQADLKVSKTDTPDPTLPDNYLRYDPVTNKFVYTYTLTIRNLGPSDAAKVVLIDQPPRDATFRLPPGITSRGVFTPTNDILCMFRDDGQIQCLVGNDPNNTGTPMRGRLNAGSVLTMTFAVEVDPSPTPRTLQNTAWVVAVAEDEFPFARLDTSDDPIESADFLDDTTPTADPNLANNTFTETTTERVA